jgi:phosphoribosylglycinamide formyltransferase-1
LKKDFENQTAFEDAMIELLTKHQIDLIVLAGFMSILSAHFTSRYDKRILNVHPSLIPSFCGKGFYGLHVHEAVLESGVKVSGATVHFVTEVCDGGPIILQGTVDVKNDDTPEVLQRRIMENVEWKLLPKAVSLFCEDRITVKDGKAYVDLK